MSIAADKAHKHGRRHSGTTFESHGGRLTPIAIYSISYIVDESGTRGHGGKQMPAAIVAALPEVEAGRRNPLGTESFRGRQGAETGISRRTDEFHTLGRA